MLEQADIQSLGHLLLSLSLCATFTPHNGKSWGRRGEGEGAPNWVFFFMWGAVIVLISKILEVSCLFYMIAKISMNPYSLIYNTLRVLYIATSIV